MIVEDCMTPNPMTVAAREPVAQVTAIVFHHRIPQLPVIDERNHLIGIITERDLLDAAVNGRVESMVAEDVMTPGPETVTPASEIQDAIDILWRRRYGALPVVVGDRVVGLLSAHDLLRTLGHQLKNADMAFADR